jgi:hypothetical protein
VEIVVRNRQDSLQNLIQIKGREDSLACVEQGRDFWHFKTDCIFAEGNNRGSESNGQSKSAPFSGGSDQAVGHKTKPKVEHYAQVHMKRVVSRSRRKRRQQEEVHDVAQNNRHQRLDKIDEH